jgi:hypothetical protein
MRKSTEITEPLSIRLPRDVREWIQSEAIKNYRSQNGQVVALLKEKMDAQREQQEKR